MAQGTLAPNPILQFFDANGVPLAGGQLFTYIAGTTTPQATYIDSTENTPNTNPVVLDSDGRCVVWIGSASYKFVLEDVNSVVIWTADNIQAVPNGSITTSKLGTGAVTSTNIAAGAVTSTAIAAGAVGTTQLALNSVGTAELIPGSVTLPILVSSGEVVFKDTGDVLFGPGPVVFARPPWTSPTLLGNPTSLPLGDGVGAAWSPNGKILALAENNSEAVSLFRRFGTDLQRLTPGVDTIPAFVGTGVSWSPGGEYLALTQASTTHLVMYQRTGRSFARLFFPNGTVGTGLNGVAWSPDGQFVAYAGIGTPFVNIFQRTGIFPNTIVARYNTAVGQSIPNTTNTVLTYGTKIVDNFSSVLTSPWVFTCQRAGGYKVTARVLFVSAPTTATLSILINGTTVYSVLDLSADSQGNYGGSDWVYMNPGDQLQIIVNQNSGGPLALFSSANFNFVSVIEDTNFESLSSFAKVTDPSTLPAGAGQCVAWSPDGMFLAVGHTTTPFITIYQRSGTTFTKITNPTSLPADQVNSLSWSPDGQFLACAVNTTPFLAIYQRSGTTFTLLTNPTTLPAGQANGIKFSPAGDLLAVAHNTSPFVSIYARNGTTFTKLTDPSLLPAGNGKSVSWTPDGKYLTVANLNTPFMTNYLTSGVISADPILYTQEVSVV